MTTRCKFRLYSITDNGNGAMRTYKFHAVSGDDVPEDVRFTKFTPNGTLEVTIDNPSAQKMLAIGQYYYLDITSISSGEKVQDQ